MQVRSELVSSVFITGSTHPLFSLFKGWDLEVVFIGFIDIPRFPSARLLFSPLSWVGRGVLTKLVGSLHWASAQALLGRLQMREGRVIRFEEFMGGF